MAHRRREPKSLHTAGLILAIDSGMTCTYQYAGLSSGSRRAYSHCLSVICGRTLGEITGAGLAASPLKCIIRKRRFLLRSKGPDRGPLCEVHVSWPVHTHPRPCLISYFVSLYLKRNSHSISRWFSNGSSNRRANSHSGDKHFMSFTSDTYCVSFRISSTFFAGFIMGPATVERTRVMVPKRHFI